MSEVVARFKAFVAVSQFVAVVVAVVLIMKKKRKHYPKELPLNRRSCLG